MKPEINLRFGHLRCPIGPSPNIGRTIGVAYEAARKPNWFRDLAPRIVSLFLLVVVVAVPRCRAQASASVPTAAKSPYLQFDTIPYTLEQCLIAMGDRFRVPGKERLTLAGSYVDSKGSGNIRLTSELPDKTRIDLTSNGTSTHSLVFDGAVTRTDTTTVSDADDDLIESLADDRVDTLLFGFGQPDFTSRFLGGWFRTDDGKNKNYTGPFYHIHQIYAIVRERSDQVRRVKFVMLDTFTALPAEVKYEIQRAGSTITVETIYSAWSQVSGQAVPGQIVRRENGVDVVKIQVSAAQFSPAATDGLFSKP